MRVVRDGEGLARQTGLLDARGRPVRGLPPPVVSGGVCDAEAAWRGAFLAHGSLTEPGRSSALEITCPGPEAALALVGAARRLGVTAKAREVRGADRVVVRDGDAISALLTRMGAHESGAGLGGAADAPRGPGHREPAGQLRRREPAPLGPGRGGRRRAGGAGAGDPRRRRARPPAGRGQAARRAHPGLAGGARSARRPADDQGRGRRAGSAGCCTWPTSAPPTSASRTPSRRSPRTCWKRRERPGSGERASGTAGTSRRGSAISRCAGATGRPPNSSSGRPVSSALR